MNTNKLNEVIKAKLFKQGLRNRSFSVTGEQIEQLGRISRDTNISMNQLVRTCIDALIEVHNQS